MDRPQRQHPPFKTAVPSKHKWGQTAYGPTSEFVEEFKAKRAIQRIESTNNCSDIKLGEDPLIQTETEKDKI